jgi:glycosyltransferase involved in cell wall biosynthesis
MNSLITVLMSVYNGEKFLEECILSVLNQSFKKFEFIIINDGSTDGSKNIIRKFSILDKRIRLINQKNCGIPKSLNMGIVNAKSDWIAKIDCDDLCQQNRLEVQYNYVINNKSVILIGSDHNEIDKNNKLVKIHNYPTKSILLKKNLFECKKFFSHSSSFYSTKIARVLGGYREHFDRASDFDLFLRFSKKGDFCSINEPLVSIRKHSNQVSNEQNGKEQIVYSRVALLSYYMRNNNLTDPVSPALSTKNFIKIYNFVKNDYNIKTLNNYYLFLKKVKLNYSKKENVLLMIIFLFKNLNLVIYHFFFNIYGDRTGYKIYQKWKKLNYIKKNITK